MAQLQPLLRISDTRRPELRLAWFEAVALVEALAESAEKADWPGPVEFEQAEYLGESSFLIPLGEGPNEAPARQLGRLLQFLIEGKPVPAELRLLSTTSGSATDTLTSFREALAYFARPNRLDVVRSVFERLSTLPPLPEAPALPIAMVEAVLPEPPVEQPAVEEPPSLTAVRIRRVMGVAAAAILGLLTTSALGAVWWAQSRTVEPVAEVVPPPPAEEAPPARAHARPADALHVSELYRVEGWNDHYDSWPLSASSSTPAEPPATPEPEADAEASTASTTVAAGAIFSAFDPDVVPPVMLKKYLPTRRLFDPGAEFGTAVLLVNERGGVDNVQLHSPNNLYQERMLISAMKAWRFRPARLGPLPVRYRLVVPLQQ